MQFRMLCLISGCLGISACNSGYQNFDLPKSNSLAKLDSSRAFQQQKITSQKIEGLNLHYVTTAGSSVAVLSDEGNIYSLNQNNIFTKVSSSAAPNNILYLSSFNNSIYMSGTGGEIYSTSNNFNTIESTNVGKNIALYGVTVVDNKFLAVGYNGNIFMKNEANSDWENRYLGGYTLYSISSDNKKNIVAVGNSGTIWVSQDSGGDWRKILVKDSAGNNISSNLYQVKYINGDFFIAGDNATILQSKDLGLNWEKVNFQKPDILNKHLKSISTVWDNNLYKIIAVGTQGTIITSNDNGRSWQIESSGTSEHLLNIDCTAGGTQGLCYAVSPENIFLSRDKGKNWQMESIVITKPGQLALSTSGNTFWVNRDYNVHLILSGSSDIRSPIITTANADGKITLKTNECYLTSAANSCDLIFHTGNGNFGSGTITITASGYQPATIRIAYHPPY